MLLAAVAAVAVLLALGALVAESRADPIDIGPLGWMSGAALVFNALSMTLRWLLTHNRGRIFLLGKLPMTLASIKLCAFLATVILIAVWLLTVIISSPIAQAALRALVLGLLAWTALIFVVNGLLNCVIIVRHSRGQLATTSREHRR